VNRNLRFHSCVAAWKWKGSLLRYRLVRQSAAIRLALRRVNDRVYLWPPFGPTDEANLARVKVELSHYLSGFEKKVLYFGRKEDRLAVHEYGLTASTVAATPEISSREAKIELRRARYCLLWRSDRVPRAISLNPHVYHVGQRVGSADVCEWLRLVSDIYLAERSRPVRAASLPTNLRSCAVLGSGPSVEHFFDEGDRWEGWIGCNFLVCDDRIIRTGKPVAYCTADPAFYSPAETFRVWRKRLFQFLRETPCVYVTLADFAPFIELNFPEDIKAKCHYVKTLGHDSYRATTSFRNCDFTVTPYGNVLTDLMLPVATCVSRRIGLYGCDGQPPGATDLPKSPRMHECDESCWNELPHARFGDPSNYMDTFGLYTSFVVAQCRKHGSEFALRAPSWNTGLRGVPLLSENRVLWET